MSKKIRVGIVFGGQSAEHEISILSARNILEALDRSRFEPRLIGIDKAGHWLVQDEPRFLANAGDPRLVQVQPGAAFQLTGGMADAPRDDRSDQSLDVVFPILHGTLGEDGTIQGLLEVAGIPYVGAGVLGSAIGMDKDVAKRLLRDAGIPIATFQTVRRPQFDADRQGVCESLAALGYPLFTKPANAGSSVGVRRVADPKSLAAALEHAFEFDSKVIAESAVVGREIELAVLGGNPPTVSVPGEIVVQHADGFYSYEAKYLDAQGARLELPARLSADECARAQALALRTFEVLECDGLARVDLFLRPDGKFFVNEINTMPGFTAMSMYPKLWGLSGLRPADLVSRLIDLALERAAQKHRIRRSVGA